MSESGGPIFEGSANFTPPKKGMVEKLKQKASEVHLSEKADKVRVRIADRLKQNTGMIVEKKWMDAYQKTVDALDSGKRKKVLEKLKPVAWLVSKSARLGAAINGVFLYGIAAGDIVTGGADLLTPNKRIKQAQDFEPTFHSNFLDMDLPRPESQIDDMAKRANFSKKRMMGEGAKGLGKGLVEGYLAKIRIHHVAAGWMGDIAGIGGEKVAQISNKIFSGKAKAEMPAPQTAT